MGTGITCMVNDYPSLQVTDMVSVTFALSEGDDILRWYNSLEGNHNMTYNDGVWHVKSVNNG